MNGNDAASPGPSGQQRPALITPEMLAPVSASDARVDFERGMSHLPRTTVLLVAVCAAVFAWEAASGVLEGKERVIPGLCDSAD